MLVELIKRALERFPGDKKPTAIESDSRFAELLHEYVRAGLALERQENEMNGKIHAVLEQHIGLARETAEAYNRLEKQLLDYAERRRDAFLKTGTDDEDGKAVDFGVALVKFRKNPDRVIFVPDEDAAIKELRAKGLSGFYQTTDTVLKNVIKATPWVLSEKQITSIRLTVGKEKITIQPKRESVKVG